MERGGGDRFCQLVSISILIFLTKKVTMWVSLATRERDQGEAKT